MTFPTNEIIPAQYFEYYQKLKALYLLHNELNFGSSPDIPQVFSERVSKMIFGYSDWDSRDFDAKNKKGLAVEIKGTESQRGTTTINLQKIRTHKSKFSHILWVNFDFENDQFLFHKIPLKSLSDRLKNINEKKNRESITLSKLTSEEKIIFQVDTLNKKLTRQ